MQKTTVTQKVNNDNIVEQYGKKISHILGIDLIKSIKEVTAKSLGLGNGDYPEIHKLGSNPLLKNHIVVRGTLSGKRKFIAVKIDVLNESHKHIYTITEIIFQRYSEQKNEYMVKYTVTTDLGIECYSLLCEDDCLEDTDLYTLKQILTMKEVKVARYSYKLREDSKYFKEVVRKTQHGSFLETEKTVILRKHISPPLKLNRKPYTDCKITCVY